MKMLLGVIALAGMVPLAVVAQDAAEVQADGAETAPAEEKPRYFSTLPVLTRADGNVEALRPGKSEWEPVEEKLRYPLGTTFRTTDAGSAMTLTFGKNCEVKIGGNSSFCSKIQPLDDLTRTLVLGEGTVGIRLPGNMKPGYFSVSAPGFVVKNLSGESVYTRTLKGDGDSVRIKCVSGTMAIEGRHFTLPDMRSQNEVRIRTEHDNLFTAIYGIAGDYYAKLDRGLFDVKNIENGTVDIEHRFLDWKVAPLTAVRISRAKPSIGERMSVAVKTFDPSGELMNDWAFTEGRFEVNTGEIAPMSKERKAELDKKMEEAGDAAASAESTAASGNASAEAKASEDDDF